MTSTEWPAGLLPGRGDDQAHRAGAGLTRAARQGPIVWLDMDRRSSTTPTIRRSMRRTATSSSSAASATSELARERIGAPKRFVYGPTAIEGIDVFTAKRRTHR